MKKRVTILLNGNQIQLTLKDSEVSILRNWFELADNDNTFDITFDDGSYVLLRRSGVVALSIIAI